MEKELYKEISRLHDELWMSVQKTVLHCINCKSNVGRKPGDKPGIVMGWTGSEAFFDSRESIAYRSNAMVWHVSLLQDLLNNYVKKIETTAFETGENIQVRREAMHKLGYLLDDIVFNAMSVFDYLADFILKCHFPDYRGNRTWDRLVTKTSNKIDDKSLVKLLKEVNSGWVKRLNRYRGDVIHNRPEMGAVGLTITHDRDGHTFVHDITLPDRMLELLPIFDSGENVQILTGAMRITRETLKHALSIVNALGSYEYKLLRKSVLEQSKYA